MRFFLKFTMVVSFSVLCLISAGMARAQVAKEITNSVGMKLVLIPKGTFKMGSPVTEATRFEDEEEHEVALTSDYYLGRFEVTQQEFVKVMGYNESRFQDSPRLPVDGVTWFDAVMFCNKLSELDGCNASYRISDVEKEGRSIVSADVELIPGTAGYRLPTEAEWEYACRGGSKTAYSFGASPQLLGDYGWYKNNSDLRTHRVGEKKPNAWGLCDMHGNVWEWCEDWYELYPSTSVTDPSGPESGSYRVFRGGSFNFQAALSRSALRDRFPPNHCIGGFRVALSATAKPK